MTSPNEPRREHPSTYIVQDRSNLDEMARLQIQDQLLTTMMGGLLPEQPDPTSFHTVLDVGCGTGIWLIETAKAYPNMTRLAGVDVSSKMLDHARSEAEAQGVSDRVEFQVGDALRMLEFPDNTFDLINHRMGMGWVRKWEWPKLLSEYQRVCKPGGIIRITEGDLPFGTDIPALTTLSELTLQSFYQAGNFFSKSQNGMTSHLASLLDQSGILNVQTRAHSPQYRFGTPEWQLFFEDMKRFYRTAAPFLRKWTHVPENYEEIYQQMLVEFQQPSFVVTWSLLTAWGTNPRRHITHDTSSDA